MVIHYVNQNLLLVSGVIVKNENYAIQLENNGAPLDSNSPLRSSILLPEILEY